MIDFIKLDINYIPEEKLLAIEELCGRWSTTVDRSTGEEIYPIIAKIDNLEIICHKPYRRELRGSLHKYFNIRKGNGKQNYNMFTLRNLQWVIKDLEDRFGLIPDKSKILNVEYGVNLKINTSPTALIAENIISYKNIPIYKLKKYGKKGYYTEHELSEYVIKIYDKSRQYKDAPRGTLRFEVKTLKSRHIHFTGIQYLSDLVNPKLYRALSNDLLSKLMELKIVEKIEPKKIGMSKKEAEIYLKYANPKFWETLEPSKRYYNKNKFIELLLKYDLHYQLMDLIDAFNRVQYAMIRE